MLSLTWERELPIGEKKNDGYFFQFMSYLQLIFAFELLEDEPAENAVAAEQGDEANLRKDDGEDSLQRAAKELAAAETSAAKPHLALVLHFPN